MARSVARRYPSPSVVLVVLAVLGLSGACSARRPSAWAATTVLGGNRPLAALDHDGDGVVREDDWRALAALAERAGRELFAAGIDPAVSGGLYQGPRQGTPSILSFVLPGGDVAPVGDRGREAYVELRWLTLQARLAAAGAGDLRGPVGGMLAAALPGYDSERMEPAVVCGALERLDTRAYERAGLPPTAVLDVDSTVWRGNGTDAFLAAMIARELPRPEANAGLAAFLATLPGVDRERVIASSVLENAKLLYERATDDALPQSARASSKDAFYQTVALLAGIRVEDARSAAAMAVHDGAGGLPPAKARVFADRDGCGMARIIRTLAARGVDIYFLSASPDVMTVEAARLFGVRADRALGSILEVKDGRYTGRVRDNTYAVKGPVTRQWLAAPPIVAFGDSPMSDLPMLLEAAGAGFMVNPHAAFVERDVVEAGGRLVAVDFDGVEGERTVPTADAGRAPR